jgi:hypothetical protein
MKGLETCNLLKSGEEGSIENSRKWVVVAVQESRRGGQWEHLDWLFLSLSKGDFVDPCLRELILILKLPRWLKGLLAFLLKPLVRV